MAIKKVVWSLSCRSFHHHSSFVTSFDSIMDQPEWNSFSQLVSDDQLLSYPRSPYIPLMEPFSRLENAQHVPCRPSFSTEQHDNPFVSVTHSVGRLNSDASFHSMGAATSSTSHVITNRIVRPVQAEHRPRPDANSPMVQHGMLQTPRVRLSTLRHRVKTLYKDEKKSAAEVLETLQRQDNMKRVG